MDDEDRQLKYAILEAIATQREATIYDIREEVNHHLKYNPEIDVDSIYFGRLLEELGTLEEKGLIVMPGDGYEMSEKSPYRITEHGVDICKLYHEQATA